MSELSNVIALINEQKRIRKLIKELAEAVHQYREELNPPQYPSLRKCYFDSWELGEHDDTIIATFHENWNGGGSRTVIFPLDYLVGNWRAEVWAEDQKRRLQEAANTTRRAAEQSDQQKERDLAELKRLQEKYPEAK